MPTNTNKPSSLKPTGRKPPDERGEQTTIRIPPSLKTDTKRAIMMATFLDPEGGPADFTAYVLRAVREQIARDEAAFAKAGGVLPKK